MSGCPKCRRKGRVIDTRHRHRVAGIRRRRECLVCDVRWTTWEVEWDVERIDDYLREIETAMAAVRKVITTELRGETRDSSPLVSEARLRHDGGAVPPRPQLVGNTPTTRARQ